MANDNNKIQVTTDESQIVLYQPDESISLQVKIEKDTVWLTQAQMVELFGSCKADISEHIYLSARRIDAVSNCSEIPNS